MLFTTIIFAQLPLDSNGWSIIKPSSDSRIIYVSYSQGNDNNDGLSISTPKKTIESADLLMRDGFPDYMLLKRDDTWPDFNGFDRWKNGKSATEPIVVSYYGNSGKRPIIKTINMFLNPNGYGFNYQAFIGLDIYNSKHDPDSPDFIDSTIASGIRLIGGGRDIIFEDCKIRFMQLTTSTYTSENHEDNLISNFKLRRCIFTDMWAHNTATIHSDRPQGYYATSTHGILVEECVFDHNGWNESFADANANMYNHNIYMSTSNYGPIIVRGNIFSRASAHGLQLRSGGTSEDNLFVRNAIGMNVGYTEYPKYNNENTYVRRNVIIEGRPQIPNDFTAPQSGAIWGIWKQLINNYYCDNNIVCNIYNTNGNNILPFAAQTANEFGKGNIAWNWVDNNEPTINPGWLDPDRTIASYNATRGKTNSFEAFIEDARNRPVGTWPLDLSAKTINNYIRQGFTISGNTNPIASFVYTNPGTVSSTVNFTSTATDADNDSLEYTWIFQDVSNDELGNIVVIDKKQSYDKNPSYTYSYPGKHLVKLTVNDGNGGISFFEDTIIIVGNFPPFAIISADIASGFSPLVVKFDASKSFDKDNDLLTYSYDFGDGSFSTSTDIFSSHVFKTGNFKVKLTVTDDAGNTSFDSLFISVTDQTIDIKTYYVVADALLDFTNADSNFGEVAYSQITMDDNFGILKFDFSENTNEILDAKIYITVKYGTNKCAVKHIEDDTWEETTVTWNNQPNSFDIIDSSVEGIFDVTEKLKLETDNIISILLVETTAGYQEFRYKEADWAKPYLQIESRVSTSNLAPVAKISVDTTEGLSPLLVNFDASNSFDSDGDSLTYLWDFGDGSILDSNKIIQKTFENNGSYTVTLIVNDGKDGKENSTSITSVTITVGNNSDIDENKSATIKTTFLGNIPNPFNPITAIHYSISKDDSKYLSSLKIFDLKGSLIKNIKLTQNKYGKFKTNWLGLNTKNQSCASGIYIIKLNIGNKVYTKKALLLR